MFASSLALEDELASADLVVGAVLVAGARAPHAASREQLSLMQPGAVIVDVSIDQGGCVETSRPTTHSDPTFEVDGIVHYCVANIPGAVPITSTHALTNAALLYVLQLADLGPSAALSADELFALGLKVAAGRVTYRPVADAQQLDNTPALDVLAELTHFVAAAW